MILVTSWHSLAVWSLVNICGRTGTNLLSLWWISPTACWLIRGISSIYSTEDVLSVSRLFLYIVILITDKHTHIFWFTSEFLPFLQTRSMRFHMLIRNVGFSGVHENHSADLRFCLSQVQIKLFPGFGGDLLALTAVTSTTAMTTNNFSALQLIIHNYFHFIILLTILFSALFSMPNKDKQRFLSINKTTVLFLQKFL